LFLFPSSCALLLPYFLILSTCLASATLVQPSLQLSPATNLFWPRGGFRESGCKEEGKVGRRKRLFLSPCFGGGLRITVGSALIWQQRRRRPEGGDQREKHN
jgi:hypothetical protein